MYISISRVSPAAAARRRSGCRGTAAPRCSALRSRPEQQVKGVSINENEIDSGVSLSVSLVIIISSRSRSIIVIVIIIVIIIIKRDAAHGAPVLR